MLIFVLFTALNLKAALKICFVHMQLIHNLTLSYRSA